jgi:hypothetical protein
LKAVDLRQIGYQGFRHSIGKVLVFDTSPTNSPALGFHDAQTGSAILTASENAQGSYQPPNWVPIR